MMLTRILLTVATLGVGAGVAGSQPLADLNVPGPCRSKTVEDLPALEGRKDRLERQIAEARAAKAVGETSAKKLSKSQVALLEVLFQIQCHKMRQQAASAEPAEPSIRASKRRSVVSPNARSLPVLTYSSDDAVVPK